MQLYARNDQKEVIYAGQALKQVNYRCLECDQVVRKRSGLHRQTHFYHLHPNESCAQHGKSMTHLMLQRHLQTMIPFNEVRLEYRFPCVGRIADVVWLTQKIVFEIQCSPITADEVIARNKDYASAGYKVVWVLHDSRFNQKRQSAAELVLTHLPHYYTDMDSQGKGSIYEQIGVVIKGIRKERLPRALVNLSLPCHKVGESMDLFPKIAKQKIQNHIVHFAGDTIDHCLSYLNQGVFSEYLKMMILVESRWSLPQEKKDWGSLTLGSFFILIWNRIVVEPYLAILRLLVEKACQ